MPKPRKVDLMPREWRDWLASELATRGFAEIEEITEALNDRLEQDGQQLSLSKSAVGRYSKLLKQQNEAFSMAETLLADMDLEGESDMHKALMQMIAAAAMRLMQGVVEEGGELAPRDLMSLGKMLKDLMSSAGIREKLMADERKRIAEEARAALLHEQAEALEVGVSRGAINAEAAAAARQIMGFG